MPFLTFGDGPRNWFVVTFTQNCFFPKINLFQIISALACEWANYKQRLACVYCYGNFHLNSERNI